MPKADSILVRRRTLNGELNGVGAYSPRVAARLRRGKPPRKQGRNQRDALLEHTLIYTHPP